MFRIFTVFGYGNDPGYFPGGREVPVLEYGIVKVGEAVNG